MPHRHAAVSAHEYTDIIIQNLKKEESLLLYVYMETQLFLVLIGTTLFTSLSIKDLGVVFYMFSSEPDPGKKGGFATTPQD